MSAQPQRRQAARLPRPAARYWKGKAPKGAEGLASSDEDSDAEGQEHEREVEEEGDEFIQEVEDEDEEVAAPVVEKKRPRGGITGVKVALKDVNISKEGRVIVAGKEESGKTQVEVEEEEEEDDDEEEEEGEKAAEEEVCSSFGSLLWLFTYRVFQSSEYESGSESEEEPPKPQFRPVFVPK